MKKRWTKEEEDLIKTRFVDGKIDYIFLIEHLTRSRLAIHHRAVQLGLVSRHMDLVREQRAYQKQGKRRCCICHGVFPLTTEFFHLGSKKCKKCVSKTQKNRLQTMDIKSLIHHRLKETKYRAKRKHLHFSLTQEDIELQYAKQNGKCYYTGRPLTNPSEDVQNFSLSIDRIDSARGYERANVVLCGSIVNNMKLDLTTDQFYQICREIVSRQ